MTIYFYGVSEQPYGCFSNFAPYGVLLDGLWWPTTEHYFQAQKFAGTAHAEAIRQARSPMIAARMGRSRQRPLRPDWNEVKDDIMRAAVQQKFTTHAALRAVLLGTGDDLIIEKTTRDYYWGCGTLGTGRNMLGAILMEVRALLREQGSSINRASGEV